MRKLIRREHAHQIDWLITWVLNQERDHKSWLIIESCALEHSSINTFKFEVYWLNHHFFPTEQKMIRWLMPTTQAHIVQNQPLSSRILMDLRSPYPWISSFLEIKEQSRLSASGKVDIEMWAMSSSVFFKKNILLDLPTFWIRDLFDLSLITQSWLVDSTRALKQPGLIWI
jgi:hypothetical protein